MTVKAVQARAADPAAGRGGLGRGLARTRVSHVASSSAALAATPRGYSSTAPRGRGDRRYRARARAGPANGGYIAAAISREVAEVRPAGTALVTLRTCVTARPARRRGASSAAAGTHQRYRPPRAGRARPVALACCRRYAAVAVRHAPPRLPALAARRPDGDRVRPRHARRLARLRCSTQADAVTSGCSASEPRGRRAASPVRRRLVAGGVRRGAPAPDELRRTSAHGDAAERRRVDRRVRFTSRTARTATRGGRRAWAARRHDARRVAHTRGRR